MTFSPETVRGSCRGKSREISDEILLLLFPQEMKLESAQKFSRLISRQFSRDVLQLQMPNFMAFFTLQTFVLDNRCAQKEGHLQRLQGLLKKYPDSNPSTIAIASISTRKRPKERLEIETLCEGGGGFSLRGLE